MSKQQVQLLNRSIDLGNVAYEGLEHVAAVIEGLQAIAADTSTLDHIKVMQVERIAKAALYLADDYANLVDAEVERLKEALKGVSHEN